MLTWLYFVVEHTVVCHIQHVPGVQHTVVCLLYNTQWHAWCTTAHSGVPGVQHTVVCLVYNMPGDNSLCSAAPSRYKLMLPAISCCNSPSPLLSWPLPLTAAITTQSLLTHQLSIACDRVSEQSPLMTPG